MLQRIVVTKEGKSQVPYSLIALVHQLITDGKKKKDFHLYKNFELTFLFRYSKVGFPISRETRWQIGVLFKDHNRGGGFL
jgi:hypothetical protein